MTGILYISKFVLHVGPEKNKNKPRRRSLKLLILGQLCQLCQLSDTRKAMAVSAGDVLSSVAAEEAAALSTVEVKRPFEPQVSAKFSIAFLRQNQVFFSIIHISD